MSAARTRTQKPQLRAVVYVRLSSHRGDTDPSTSPARQEAVCRAYCEAKGWQVVKVVSDLDVSGSDKGQRLARPGLNKIRELWGDVDIVIFAKLDRLARNVIDFRAFADEAEQNGAALVSVAESLDLTTPGGRFVATILAAFAEMEAATIAERTSSGMRAARELGRWTGGPIPFGYQVASHPSGQGKTLVPQPSEADLVREMARRILAGETAYALAADLNTRGDLARGYAWRQTNVRRLVTSAPVVGRIAAGGDFLRDEAGAPRQLWEPVLALPDWQALRAKFTPDESRAARKRADWLLSGLVRCALCEGPCSAGQGQHGTRRYRCSARANAPGSCVGVAINAEALEAYVETQALATFGHFTTSRREVVELDDGRRADIEASMTALAAQITQQGADIPALSMRLAAFAAERDALPATAARRVHVVPTGLTWAEEYKAGDLAKRRELLSDVLTVHVSRGRRGVRGLDESRVAIDGVTDPYAAELESILYEGAIDAA